MRRLVTVLLLVGTCVSVVLLTGATSEKKEKATYKIIFDNSFGLVEGGDFRVGGVKAGKTSKFDVLKKKGQAAKAVVTAELSQPGFDDFREDATCTILPQSLIGEYYVDCQTGKSKKKLPKDGSGVVPVTQTESTIPADLVGNILRRPYRERFRMIITELGTGLAGRPGDLQEVLRRAHPGLRETSKVLKILGDQNQIIENFIRDSDTVVAELEANKRDVARFITEAGDAAEISATRRADIARSFRRLPVFLDELRPTMRRLGQLADAQRPLLADLDRAAPDLDTFITRLGPFAKASRPAVRALGRSSRRGTQALREGTQEIRELKNLAPKVQPTFKPLRQFLQTIDDRRRALENDPRAKIGSPPAPDKTAIPGEGGFTGMEAIWNYFFWQTLSLNGKDDISHALRLSVTINACSNLDNDINFSSPSDRKHFEECSQWLGPDLPGLTSPDFTDGGSTSTSRLQEQASRPASRVGERRAPGQPDAGPLPGQEDISKPNYALPPALQQLLDQLDPDKQRQNLPQLPKQDVPAPQLPQGVPDPKNAPAPQTQDQNQLLDFLLSP